MPRRKSHQHQPPPSPLQVLANNWQVLFGNLSSGEPVIVSSPESVANAIAILRRERVLACDLEGVHLGRGGSVNIAQIATPHTVFIFDFHSIEFARLVFDSGLREVMSNPQQLLVMHDCRCDSDALFHLFDVSLTNVFDTQGVLLF